MTQRKCDIILALYWCSVEKIKGSMNREGKEIQVYNLTQRELLVNTVSTVVICP
jgi:hypothetical protein